MALKFRSVHSDGRSAAGEEFDFVPLDPDGQPYDGVCLRLTVVTKKQAADLARQYQKQVANPKSRQMEWQYIDGGQQLATDALLAAAIVGWSGVIGADDAPLVCAPDTIAAMDDRIKAQVIGAIFGAEVVEQQSFREPASVLPLAARQR